MIKKTIRKYYKSVLWLFLGTISHTPNRFIRTYLLKVTQVKIHNTAILYGGFHIRKPSQISIGSGTVIGHGVTLDGRNKIRIGNNVNFSSDVMIWTMQHDYNDTKFKTSGGPVIIEDYAWVSVRAIILPNVTIGEGAVVAAGAIVTKDVLPFTIVGGIPAKKIGVRNENLAYSPSEGGGLPFI